MNRKISAPSSTTSKALRRPLHGYLGNFGQSSFVRCWETIRDAVKAVERLVTRPGPVDENGLEMMKRHISTEVRGGDAGKLIVDTMIEMMLMPGVSGIGEIARDERGGDPNSNYLCSQHSCLRLFTAAN